MGLRRSPSPMHAERVTACESVVGDVCKPSHGDVPAFTAMKRGVWEREEVWCSWRLAVDGRTSMV